MTDQPSAPSIEPLREWWKDNATDQSIWESGYGWRIQEALQAYDLMSQRAERLETWQPIATAPKDGTRILVCSGNAMHIEVCRWAWERWMSAPGDYNRNPSFWMPLPTTKPPTVLSENKEGKL